MKPLVSPQNVISAGKVSQPSKQGPLVDLRAKLMQIFKAAQVGWKPRQGMRLKK